MKFTSIILLSFALISSANAAQPIVSSNLITQGSGPSTLPPIDGARIKLALKVQIAQSNVTDCVGTNQPGPVDVYNSLSQINSALDYTMSGVGVSTTDPKHPVINVAADGQTGFSIDFTISEDMKLITSILFSTTTTQTVTTNTGTILNPVFQHGTVTSLNPVYVCHITN